VVVAHPGKVRLIFRAKRKNDRIDARKLAKLLFLDEVPLVYVPSADRRMWRSMIEARGQRFAPAPASRGRGDSNKEGGRRGRLCRVGSGFKSRTSLLSPGGLFRHRCPE
jgi:hypothetical protein